jgi:outer membrane receptor protein involved in Fe transport
MKIQGSAMTFFRRQSLYFGFIFATLFITFLGATPSQAQTFRGTILGTVTDSTGALLVGATVTVHNVDTGTDRITETTTDGGYLMPELPVGAYDVTFTMKGFQKVTTTGVTVTVAGERRVDATLKPGATSQSITVSGETLPTVETASDTLGGTFESQQVEELPINGRDYTKLLIMVPGTAGEPNGGGDSPGSYGLFSADGSRGRSNNYLLDGTDMNDGYRNLPAINQGGVFGVPGTILPEDSIQELNVLTNFEAEYGRNSGAVVSIVTKSGTNQFHGSAFEDFRNAVLNARNYFNFDGQPKDAFRNNQFGGSVGGPIVKDKTFFYASYEGQREGMAITSLNSVPTLNDPANTSGTDYAQAIATLGGNTAACTTTVIACIQGNSAVINPVISNLYNLCNSNGHCSGGTNVWPTTSAVGGPATNNLDSALIKIDQNLNPNNQISGRYFFGNSHQSFPLGVGGGNNLPNTNTNAPIRTQLVSVSWVRTVSPEKVNEARFGWNRYRNGFFPQDAAIFGDPNASLELNTIDLLGPANPRDYGLPTIEVGGLAHLGSSAFANPRNRVDSNWQFFDNFSWKLGRHDIKFGGEFRRTTVNSFNDLVARSELEFNGLADFLAGGLSGATENFGNTSRNTHQNSWGFYVQDGFHVNSRLTVNAGLRWDYAGVIGTDGNQFSIYNPSVGLVRPSQLYPKDLNNFAPRLSAAYDPFGKGKTIVRAGVGVFYDGFSQDFFTGQLAYNTDNTGPAYNPIGPNPVFITYNLNPALPVVTNPLNPLVGDTIIQPTVPVFDPASVTPGTASSTDAFTVSRNLRTPYVYNYNLNIQQQLLPNTVLQVGYVGSTGRKLFYFRDINQPTHAEITTIDEFCGFTATISRGTPQCPGAPIVGFTTPLSSLAPNPPFFVNELETGANSNYNSMQISLTQRNWHRFNNQISYTWSHSIDTASDGEDYVPNAAQPNDSTNPGGNKGPSNFDVRNRFVMSSVYDLAKIDRLKKFGEGWSFSGILTLMSGHPFSLNYAYEGDYDGSGEGFGRPDVVAPIQYNYSNPAEFLNLASFSVPCTLVGGTDTSNCVPGTRHFGSEGRNSLLGPDYKNLDFAISKMTSINERFKLQFRADFYNIANHPNFASPLLPAFFADAAPNGISTGSGMNGNVLPLGRSLGFYPITETSDVGLGNPVLGGGGARSIQFAVKLLF